MVRATGASLKKIPWLVFGLMLLFAILYVTRTVADMPPLVASHFDSAGHANAYMARSSYTKFILGTLIEERVALQERHGKRVPLLVKVAPDLSEAQVSELAQQLRSLQPDGVIATNTSSDLNVLGKPAAEHRGGLSGAPLHSLSVKVITQLRAELGADFPIIGVGGIVSAANARETLRAGANLLQVYTGFAYRGLGLLEELIGSPE